MHEMMPDTKHHPRRSEQSYDWRSLRVVNRSRQATPSWTCCCACCCPCFCSGLHHTWTMLASGGRCLRLLGYSQASLKHGCHLGLLRWSFLRAAVLLPCQGMLRPAATQTTGHLATQARTKGSKQYQREIMYVKKDGWYFRDEDEAPNNLLQQVVPAVHCGCDRRMFMTARRQLGTFVHHKQSTALQCACLSAGHHSVPGHIPGFVFSVRHGVAVSNEGTCSVCHGMFGFPC